MTDLQHAGVKGMKWGVRKDKERSPKQQAKDQRKIDKKVMRKQTSAVKRDKYSVSRMSDSDIKSRINRMQLEKQYLSLADERATYHQSAGKKILKRLFGNSVPTSTQNKVIQTGVNVGLKKAAASVTNPQAAAAMEAFAMLNQVKKK